MTFADAVGLALRNLRQAKLRTALTTLGVAIGIASLAGMVSLGVGLQDQFVDRFTRSGMFDSINVLPGNIDPRGFVAGGRGRGRGAQPNAPAAQDAPPPRPLDDQALATLAALENVKDVYPMIRVPVEIRFGDHSEFTQVAGVPMSARGQGPFATIMHGEFFRSDSDAACMISLEMGNRLVNENPSQLVGKELTLGYASSSPVAAPPAMLPGVIGVPTMVQRAETRCRIIGIVERETGPMAVGGSMVTGVMIPLPKAREINEQFAIAQRTLMRGRGMDGKYQTVTVKVTRTQHTQDVEERIRKLGYSAFSLNDALQGARRAFLVLDIILGLTGSIALTVASLGIINTMVMSILERTREIGIMKAIGGSDGDVRRIFLVEASAIGLLGGIAGILLGWLVGRIINFGANYYIVQQGGTPGNLFSLPIWLIAGALGFALVVSLAAGVFPARRAARLDPIHALRHD
jgi:ABC-type antimicrobial peptide transport system permease subunit